MGDTCSLCGEYLNECSCGGWYGKAKGCKCAAEEPEMILCVDCNKPETECICQQEENKMTPKEELVKELLVSVQKFEETTGVYIDSFSISHLNVTSKGSPSRELIATEIELRMEA